MAKYLVGQNNNMWKIAAAVLNAASGDIIEFQEGYCPEFDMLRVDKDLTFVGCAYPNDKGGFNFCNTITGKIFVSNGANVRIQNLWISYSEEKSNILNCKEGATLEMTNVVLENNMVQGEAYPILYAENQAQIRMENVTVIQNKNMGLRMYVENGKVEMNRCKFLNCRIHALKSELTIAGSSIFSDDSNVINVTESKLALESVKINGCAGDADRPAIWSSNSRITVKECTVHQPQYDSAVFLKDNSYLEIEGGSITSLHINDGRAMLKNTSVHELLQANDRAYVYVGGEVHLLGENENKVDVYVSDKSVVQGDKLCYYRVTTPNNRVKESSLFDVRNVEYKRGNVSELVMENDATSKIYTSVPAPQERVEAPKKEAVSSNARQQLEQMIGLKSVKKEIEKMLRMVEFNQQRIAKGLEPQEQSFHSVFLGNPGTGKTTVARLIGEVLFESGAFKSEKFQLIEASEPDFISQNVGGTAQQTLALLEKAKGGVLFIDEAYALNKKDANVNFGIEAINTILKYMEDHRGEIMIIFAGYTKEMEQFLKTNPGLTSRIPNKFVFEDYTPEEIVEIGVNDLVEKQYKFESVDYYQQQVKRAYRNSLDHSNARWIRNFNEKLLKSFADRAMNEGEEDLQTIQNVDIDDVLAQSKYKNLGKMGESAMERLDKLIGIHKVKEQVKQFVALAEFNQKREEQGKETGDFTLHSLFLGNPGTGKTTVARLVGEILYQKGIIAEKKFIEVSQSELVAGYVGQTAIKTREVLESALGGVLFIDEAYSLTQGEHNGFGMEAVNEILTFMENHRRDIVIILAGYTKEMSIFMSANSGLVSRVPHTFDFEDYTPDEIVSIGLLNLHSNDYQVDEVYYSEIVKKCYRNSNDRSNGRWVRNLNEKLIMIMSKRVSGSENADINLVLREDLDVLDGSEGTMGEQDHVSVGATQTIDENGYVLPS